MTACVNERRWGMDGNFSCSPPSFNPQKMHGKMFLYREKASINRSYRIERRRSTREDILLTLDKYYCLLKQMRGVVARRSATKGIVIFAGRSIKKGQRIMQRVGEVVTETDANVRKTLYREEGKRVE